MRKIITLLFVIVSFSAQAQWDWTNYITFENNDTLCSIAITIDTANYHHNIWQIGRPQKSVFDSAHSFPNAIVTDTLNTYLPNDTSIFIVKVPYWHFSAYPLAVFGFDYKLDIDTGVIATLEVSKDSGLHWINVIDSLPHFCYWSTLPPDFMHSTIQWKHIRLFGLNDFSHSGYDTMLFKFTFISDTIPTTKDGWMVDDIYIEYAWEGATSNIKNDNLISIYPNPSNGNIYIDKATQYAKDATATIYNTLGQEVYKTDNVPPDGNLHLQLPDGIYTLKYFAGDEYCVKRVIITQ